MYFNGEALTGESVRAARIWFAENARASAAEVLEGRTKVNDPEGYVRNRLAYAERMEEGTEPATVALLQRAYYIQTGRSIALFP